MVFNKLKTVELDTEKGMLRVNGQELGDVNEFALSFKDGLFSLTFTSSARFYATGKKRTPAVTGENSTE
ncbi:MAG: hypothetical protein IJ723_00130 [Ruminococcus sp.]|nr:hypothetical protein [Ruminococcus sp.]